MSCPVHYRTALVGWSLPAMDAAARLNRPFVVVGPRPFASVAEEHRIEFVPWDFRDKSYERLSELHDRLKDLDVEVAVPLYEETVEWAGYLNSRFRDDPQLFDQAVSLRHKPLMKRRAQLSGLSVGVFEEVSQPSDLTRFMQRVGEAQSQRRTGPAAPVHVKPFDKSGSVGHRVIQSANDVEEIASELFPCLAESHVHGQEFSCEAFVHDGRIRFLNITEYVRLGYSGFVPASETLENLRPFIRGQAQRLVDGFGVRHGILHIEFFLMPDHTLFFGEAAGRVPGGHIFELIERVYGFDAFQGQILCSDPHTSEQELEAFFPPDDGDKRRYAGCLMLYPEVKRVDAFDVPPEVRQHPYYDKYALFTPIPADVPARDGFGAHLGTVYFFGDDGREMRNVLQRSANCGFFSDRARGAQTLQPLASAHRK